MFYNGCKALKPDDGYENEKTQNRYTIYCGTVFSDIKLLSLLPLLLSAAADTGAEYGTQLPQWTAYYD